MAQNTIKGRVSSGSGDPEDLTPSQVKNMLGLSNGMNGSGTLNYVPKWTPDGATIGNSQIFDNGTNVGIGINPPTQKLDVNGAALLRGGGPLYLLDANHGIKSTSGVGVTIFSYGVPNGIFLQQSTGNVGIGTASPSNKLQIAGDTRIGLVSDNNSNIWGWGNKLYFSGGGDGASYNSDNSDELSMGRYNVGSNASDLRIIVGDDNSVDDRLTIGSTNDNTKFVFQMDGKMGIGTSNPVVRPLEIKTANGSSNFITSSLASGAGSMDVNFELVTARGSTSSNNTGDVATQIGLNYGSSGGTILNSMLRFHRGSSTTGGFMSFTTNNNTERMRIASNGTVSVNNLSGTGNRPVYADANGALTTTPYSNFSRVDPIYIRGTGQNNNSNRILKIGNTEIYNATGRGLRLTIIKKSDHSVVSTATYDTYGTAGTATNLANALNGMTKEQIGILTSYDAWEALVDNNLRTAFAKLGLYRAAAISLSSVRAPYAAIFEGSAQGHAQEILHDPDVSRPFAEMRGWLMDGGFDVSGGTSVINTTSMTASYTGATAQNFTYSGRGKPLFLVVSVITYGGNNRSGSISATWKNAGGTILRGPMIIAGTNVNNGNDGGSGMSDQSLLTIPFINGATQITLTPGGDNASSTIIYEVGIIDM